MSTGRATDKTLDAAHGFYVNTLIKEVQEYRSGLVLDRHGYALRCPISLLAELGKVLNVNGVNLPDKAFDAKAEAELEAIFADEFPEWDDDGNIVPTSPPQVHVQTPRAPAAYKRCSRCSTTLPVSEFHKNISNPDGLHGECKSCRKATKQ